MLLTEGKRDENNLGSMPTAEFKIAVNSHSFNVLFKKLYSDPVLAVMRELVCNAADSHALAKTSRRIDVHLPTVQRPQFTVRDYGIGLTRDEVFNLYTTVFESTKVGDDNVTGGFGLGSKAPFAVVDQFTVTNYRNGTKAVYIATLDGGIPKLIEAHSEPSDAPVGLEVSVPCDNVTLWNTGDRLWRAFAPFGDRVRFYNLRPEASAFMKNRSLSEMPHFDSPHGRILSLGPNENRSYILIRDVLYSWEGALEYQREHQFTLANGQRHKLAIYPGGYVLIPSGVSGFVPPSNRETLETKIEIPVVKNGATGTVTPYDMLGYWALQQVEKIHALHKEWAGGKGTPSSDFAKRVVDVQNTTTVVRTYGMPTLQPWTQYLEFCGKTPNKSCIVVSGPDDKLPAAELADDGWRALAGWLDPERDHSNINRVIPGDPVPQPNGYNKPGLSRLAIGSHSWRVKLKALGVITQECVDWLQSWGFDVQPIERPERKPRAKREQAKLGAQRKQKARLWKRPKEAYAKTHHELGVNGLGDKLNMTADELLDNDVIILPVPTLSANALKNPRDYDIRLLIEKRPRWLGYYGHYPYINCTLFNDKWVAIIAEPEWKAISDDTKQRIVDRLEEYAEAAIKPYALRLVTQVARGNHVTNAWLDTGGTANSDLFALVEKEGAKIAKKWQALAPLAVPQIAPKSAWLEYQREHLDGLTLTEWVNNNMIKEL